MGPKKQQKMSLGDFLGDQSLGSWADEMEDMPLPAENRGGFGSERRAFSSATGPDRGFAREPSGFASREPLPLPTKPPFTAHLGNLSFDATEGDVDSFFGDCSVTNVRIVEDKMERKPKGFGYVEFASVDGLKKALDKNGLQFQGRNIRISVAEPPKDRGETRELNDWTRKGPLPDLPNQRRASDRGNFRSPDNASDAGSERGGRRPPPFEADTRRDFGNWERRGPLSPVPGAAPKDNARIRDGPRERKISPSWGEGRSQEGSRPPRREYERPQPVERAPTASELDNQWRTKMRPDAPPPKQSPITTPEASVPSSPAPAMRPKLNLAKRTVSEANTTPAAADAQSSIFGGARPIDTAAREREIEEKRQQALKEKKEQDDKIREDKRAKEAAAKASSAALEKMNIETFSDDQITEKLLEDAAKLFSDHYGTWSGPEAKPITMGVQTLKQKIIPSNASTTLVRISMDDQLVGHVFGTQWKVSTSGGEKTICWVTQLVVAQDQRRQQVGTTLVENLLRAKGSSFDALGILSPNPAAIRTALKPCRRRMNQVDLDFIRKNAETIMHASPVEYVRDAKLKGSLFEGEMAESGAVCAADTDFDVNHEEAHLALGKIEEDGLVWPLGDLPERCEYLLIAGLPSAGRKSEGVKEPPSNGIVEDKAVKPKEVVVSPKSGESSWRRKPSGSGPTAENLEDDGWSTVPNRSKNSRRGGNQGARAIAS